MNWQPISTAPTDRPVFVRAVDLSGFANAIHSGQPKKDMLPGITAWTTYHPSAGFTICDIRTTVQWDADAVPPPPVIKESLTTATDDDLDEPPTTEHSSAVLMDDDFDEPLGPACSMDNLGCESCQ